MTLAEFIKTHAYIPQGVALGACEWNEINIIANMGLASVYWAVGDEKEITLTGGETVVLQILGFGHDDLVAGGKAPITFGFKNCMTTKRTVNATATNVGGYSGSALYSTITGTIYNSLPETLRDVIKDVDKLTSAGNQSASITTTEESVFLLSEIEVHGGLTYSKAGEGSQYAFFSGGGSKIKNVSGTASVWWERSPNGNNSTYFCCTNALGNASRDDANVSYGVVFGLCV